MRRSAPRGRGQTVRLVIEQAPASGVGPLGGGVVGTGGLFGLPPALTQQAAPRKNPTFK